jgi:hypothetical protein
MTDRCDLTELPPDQCAHCRGVVEERPGKPGRPRKKPSGPTLTGANGGLHEVVKLLPRPGGAVDVIVAYRVRGRKTTYAPYRHEPDGDWKALNGGWLSLDAAVKEIAHTDQYRPLISPDLKRFLADAIGKSVSEFPSRPADAVAEHVDKPTVGHWSRADDPESIADRGDYTDTPNDEGDE